jgi:site-specific DNA recombinase
MQRTIIYARVSTEDQMEKYGLPAQLRACREYAAAHGLEVIEEITDEGISGATLERAGLERLRQRVRAGAADIVLMLDPDRLSRSLSHLLIVKPEIEERARIQFVTGSFEDSASGRLFFNLKGSIAEYEREVIRDRTMRGKKERAKDGLIVGGRTCYGYRYEAGKLIPDPERAPVAQSIFAGYDAGVSLRAITRRLRETGAPTWSGRKWGHSSVRRMLTNETYAGVAHYLRSRRQGQKRVLRAAEERIAITVPALIERAQWERVQARLAQNHGSGGPSSTAYLLKGLIWCACGRRMTGERGKKSYAYRCSGRDPLRFHGGPCRGTVHAGRLDTTVWRDLTAAMSDAEQLRKLLAEHEAQVAKADPSHLARLEEQARKLKRREERALSMMLDPDLAADRGAIKAQYQEAQRGRLQLEAEIASCRRAESRAADGLGWLDQMASVLREDLREMTAPEQRQAFVRMLRARADWDGKELKMRCFIGTRVWNSSAHSPQSTDGLEFVLNVRLAA